MHTEAEKTTKLKSNRCLHFEVSLKFSDHNYSLGNFSHFLCRFLVLPSMELGSLPFFQFLSNILQNPSRSHQKPLPASLNFLKLLIFKANKLTLPCLYFSLSRLLLGELDVCNQICPFKLLFLKQTFLTN